MLFFLNHHNSLFNVSMMLSMALTLLLRTYYDTFSVFFFCFIFAFQIVRFFILFVSQSMNWNSRIQFNSGPVAQDHKHLTWIPEYVQTVTQLATEILNISCRMSECQLLNPTIFCWATKICIVGRSVGKLQQQCKFRPSNLFFRHLHCRQIQLLDT